jgi:hypothetical protein
MGEIAIMCWLARECFARLILIVMAKKSTPPRLHDPISAYEKRRIEGFTVLVNRRLFDHMKEGAKYLRHVQTQLRRIARVVRPKPLAELRKVRIWMEWDLLPNKAAGFHHSRSWLREHGYNPAKVCGVELVNARNFYKWSHDTQPWMLLHELAHSYHFRVLGRDHQGVLNAYEHAMVHKLYDIVKHVRSGDTQAYATRNQKEYFAEITEAYFGKNDFYPFTRRELRKHDPLGFQLMLEVWGQPLRDARGRPLVRPMKVVL